MKLRIYQSDVKYFFVIFEFESNFKYVNLKNIYFYYSFLKFKVSAT